MESHFFLRNPVRPDLVSWPDHLYGSIGATGERLEANGRILTWRTQAGVPIFFGLNP